MRHLLRDVAEGREVGDITTLANSGVMAQIQGGMKKWRLPSRPRGGRRPGDCGRRDACRCCPGR